jgi:hypothetical protein
MRNRPANFEHRMIVRGTSADQAEIVRKARWEAAGMGEYAHRRHQEAARRRAGSHSLAELLAQQKRERRQRLDAQLDYDEDD